MGFHYGFEKKKFDESWARLSREYIAAGMSEEDVQAMRDYDWEEFKRERVFQTHNQSLEGALFPDGDKISEDQSPLLKGYLEQFSACQPETWEWGRYDWVEDIDTPELARGLKTLPEQDLEFTSCLIVDDLSKAETSRKLNVSRAYVTKRCARIKSTLKNAGYNR